MNAHMRAQAALAWLANNHVDSAAHKAHQNQTYETHTIYIRNICNPHYRGLPRDIAVFIVGTLFLMMLCFFLGWLCGIRPIEEDHSERPMEAKKNGKCAEEGTMGVHKGTLWVAGEKDGGVSWTRRDA